ncbi:ComEA family DNA-binding protein [Pseudoalteromonas luteoviolacea]|uniref:ComEA family DNA-binding protein n=1 Tax=Pseudoalteromonas luteoviolacea TaxID=43657 RepID=UPI001B3601E5|nr:ComEA family DNA-binding protein [Pseudoalteromonas luteoviolacea]MBQ4836154.1 ComEA family DNA-binding protein [Pseudoalteromonas luteoviolacea]
MRRHTWILGLIVAVLLLSNLVQAQDVNPSEQAPLVVNVNTAQVNELIQLPGIGEAKAQAIVLSREQNGRFVDVQELERVKGIGKGLIEKLKAHVVFE